MKQNKNVHFVGIVFTLPYVRTAHLAFTETLWEVPHVNVYLHVFIAINILTGDKPLLVQIISEWLYNKHLPETK